MPLELPLSQYVIHPLICALLVAGWDFSTKSSTFTTSDILTDSLILGGSVLLTDVAKKFLIDKVWYTSDGESSAVLMKLAISTFIYKYFYGSTIANLPTASVMGLPDPLEIVLTGAVITLIANYLEDPARDLLLKI